MSLVFTFWTFVLNPRSQPAGATSYLAHIVCSYDVCWIKLSLTGLALAYCLINPHYLTPVLNTVTGLVFLLN